jgi:hypothetical protein
LLNHIKISKRILIEAYDFYLIQSYLILVVSTMEV